ncbi:phenazine biosynthesis-like domain-containing protein 2 isoform X2 [Liolophura sinensis]|uniref:phenazine biosynthesis-like domain-containing protein 2 isoform X2 n=1 Tax=Liolophura sinensis TaxID=3198878 RepID=UPI0031593E81
MFKMWFSKDSSPGVTRKLRVFTVDTFTVKPFRGNPAAVCLDLPHEGLTDELYQKIAAEMNLPMTAFVNTVNKDDNLASANRFKLRWFTPKTEWKLCGHATLASAFVLFTSLNNSSDELVFETPGGELSVCKQGELLAMNFPTAETLPQQWGDFEKFLKVLFPDINIVDSIHLCDPLGFLVIRLKDKWNREKFETWIPNAEKLPSVDSSGRVKMVIVTTRGRSEAGFTNIAGEQYDFVSRIFTPWTGLPEDPVTARQCSQRPGDLWLEVRGERTDIKGQSVLVMESHMNILV